MQCYSRFGKLLRPSSTATWQRGRPKIWKFDLHHQQDATLPRAVMKHRPRRWTSNKMPVRKQRLRDNKKDFSPHFPALLNGNFDVLFNLVTYLHYLQVFNSTTLNKCYFERFPKSVFGLYPTFSSQPLRHVLTIHACSSSSRNVKNKSYSSDRESMGLHLRRLKSALRDKGGGSHLHFLGICFHNPSQLWWQDCKIHPRNHSILQESRVVGHGW